MTGNFKVADQERNHERQPIDACGDEVPRKTVKRKRSGRPGRAAGTGGPQREGGEGPKGRHCPVCGTTAVRRKQRKQLKVPSLAVANPFLYIATGDPLPRGGEGRPWMLENEKPR